MKILILASPVGVFGSAETGGVSLMIEGLAKALNYLGHKYEIIAPYGSKRCIGIKGTLQKSLPGWSAEYYPVLPDSFLANACRYITEKQKNYDLVINAANDWLPYYLTDFLQIKTVHLLNLSSINPAIDDIARFISARYPYRVAVLSKSQAKDIGLKKVAIYRPGLDLKNYTYVESPQEYLCWAGRISPEKDIETSIKIAKKLGLKLKIAGKIEDREYFNRLKSNYPADIHHVGFLERDKLQEFIGNARAMLMTSACVEAFGMVVIESLACGTPVICRDSGGPAEIIKNGVTGIKYNKLADITPGRLKEISRAACRKHAVDGYSIKSSAATLEKWLEKAS